MRGAVSLHKDSVISAGSDCCEKNRLSLYLCVWVGVGVGVVVCKCV